MELTNNRVDFTIAFKEVLDKQFNMVLNEVNASLFAGAAGQALHLAKVIPRLKKLVPSVLESNVETEVIEIPRENLFQSTPTVDKMCRGIFAFGNDSGGDILGSTVKSLLSAGTSS